MTDLTARTKTALDEVRTIAAATLAGYVGLWHVYPTIRRELG